MGRAAGGLGLAVFLGKKLADRLPIALIHRIAAVLFLVFAVVAVVETVRTRPERGGGGGTMSRMDAAVLVEDLVKRYPAAR